MKKRPKSSCRSISRVRAAARPACEWGTYTRRKHCRHRRTKARLRRVSEGARQTSRGPQQKDRRPYTGATVLSVLRRHLAVEDSGRRSKAETHHRSAFARAVSCKRTAHEHAGISKGVQCSRWFGDGSPNGQARKYLVTTCL